MIERLFPPLVFAGPFRRSGIGGCRTFCGVTIGVCRTFFPEWLRLRGFPKPKTGLRFWAYKAFVYSKHLYSKEGSGLRPACLNFFWMRRAGGLQEQSARDAQLEGERGGDRAAVGRDRRRGAARGSPGDRLPWRSAAGQWRAERDRLFGLGKPPDPCCEGQRVADLRPRPPG
jgi:hypothetical protein